MTSFGVKIKNLRKMNNLSQKQLAEELGYKTYTTISKWEQDVSLPPSNELKKLALYFGVATDYLLGIKEISSTHYSDLPNSTVGLNYIGDNHIGAFLNLDRDKIASLDHSKLDFPIVEVPSSALLEDSDKYFVVKMTTDSMNRLINNGDDIIVIDYNKVDNIIHKTGDILVLKINGEYTVRQLRLTDTIIYLESKSTILGFDSLIYSKEAFDKLEISGKVICAFKVFD